MFRRNIFHGAPNFGKLHADQHKERTVHEVRDICPDGQTVEAVLGCDGVDAVVGHVERGHHHGDHAGAFHTVRNFDCFGKQECAKRYGHHEDGVVHGVGDVRTKPVGRPTNRQANSNAAQEGKAEHAAGQRDRDVGTSS